ncbi:MAG: UDP-N-acetylmuramate dehydrogenase [Alphaproteobacteria bacterium]|nr:MAG: UDP-N-acetylmuramate dehydrogenase [Alphaproteobacteria bacterium]
MSNPAYYPTVEPLITRLPKVRGRYTENASLHKVTWFQVGGPAEVLFKPADLEDLQNFLKEKPPLVPVTILGVGSNVLVRDGGIRGVVIRLGREFASIAQDGTHIVAGAAALDVNVARVAADAGLTGMEFLFGIPGTIGGALRMNAGAYGSEIKDILISAQVIDDEGNLHNLVAGQLGLSYRDCEVPKGWIFVGATLAGTPASKADIERRMDEIAEKRESTQPIRSRTGGSTFANPDDRRAWELVDQAGCRGLKIGGAMVSEKHTNFLINTGGATAADIENLGDEVRMRVFRHSGVELRWEIERLGEK